MYDVCCDFVQEGSVVRHYKKGGRVALEVIGEEGD